METIIVSACLLGDKCRYDGKDNYNDNVKFLKEHFNIVPICPEVFGGMSTPRVPSEQREGSVVDKNGKDVTKYFEKGRDDVLNIVKYLHIRKAVLTENSPSCGIHKVYNGRFNNTLIDGNGITTKALLELGVACYSIDEVEKLIDKTQKQLYEIKEQEILEHERINKEKAAKNAEYSTIDNKAYQEKRRAERSNYSKDGDYSSNRREGYSRGYSSRSRDDNYSNRNSEPRSGYSRGYSSRSRDDNYSNRGDSRGNYSRSSTRDGDRPYSSRPYKKSYSNNYSRDSNSRDDSRSYSSRTSRRSYDNNYSRDSNSRDSSRSYSSRSTGRSYSKGYSSNSRSSYNTRNKSSYSKPKDNDEGK